MRQLPSVKIETDYVAFGGGIDRVSPALAKKNGFALDALNYEPVPGGYKRIDGYERFDGRTAPSAANYYWVSITLVDTGLLAGHSIKGSTSGAVARVASISGGILVFTMVSGTFVNGETVTRGGCMGLSLLFSLLAPTVTVGTLTSTPVEHGATTALLDAQALNAAADIYRLDVGKVPGSGSVLGLGLLNGVLYAWKNNEQGTAAYVWKQTTTGWQLVPLGWELSFTSGGTREFAVGETVTGQTSGATGVIARVAHQTGSFAAGTAAGRLILSSTTGTFAASELLSSNAASADMGTASGGATRITLLPNGRYEILNENFLASADMMRMYGADGVNRGFEFDGTTYVPIVTGMTVDTPLHVGVQAKHLQFSFRGSSQNSSLGLPYQWTPVTGAAEIGVGDRITGYANLTQSTQAIFGRNRVDRFTGTSTLDFALDTLSPKYGAIAYTIQNLGEVYFLDDQGIRRLIAVQEYGGFADQPVSTLVQPLIDLIRGRAVASVVYRHRSQYRVYANDGSGLMLTTRGGKVIGITSLQYPIVVTCTVAGEDTTGKDVVFLGAADGYVYQCDKGSSFDGEAIEAFVRPVFNHSKSPRVRKRYRKGILEMESAGYSEIRVTPELSYGSDDLAASRSEVLTSIGPGGYWDSAVYETIVYDSQEVQNPEFSLEGSGNNVATLFYSNSDIDLGHTLQGVIFHYTPRRLAR